MESSLPELIPSIRRAFGNDGPAPGWDLFGRVFELVAVADPLPLFADILVGIASRHMETGTQFSLPLNELQSHMELGVQYDQDRRSLFYYGDKIASRAFAELFDALSVEQIRVLREWQIRVIREASNRPGFDPEDIARMEAVLAWIGGTSSDEARPAVSDRKAWRKKRHGN